MIGSESMRGQVARLFWLFALAFLGGCSSCGNATAGAGADGSVDASADGAASGQAKTAWSAWTITDPEDLAIYRTLIETLFVQADTARVVVERWADSNACTTAEGRARELAPRMPSVTVDMLADCVRRQNGRLPDDLGLGIPTILLDRGDLDPLHRESRAATHWGADGFFARYPNSSGLIRFSRIGYSADKSKSVVLVERSYPGERALWVALRRDGKTWRVLEKLEYPPSERTRGTPQQPEDSR